MCPLQLEVVCWHQRKSFWGYFLYNFIGSVYELLNSNRIWEFHSNYEVSLNSKISQLRHTWLLDRLLNDLVCAMDIKDVQKVK